MSASDALERIRVAPARVVGAHQTTKAITRGAAVEVFIAADADPKVAEPIARAAAERGVVVVEVESMTALGRACGIAVGATAAAVLIVSPDPS